MSKNKGRIFLRRAGDEVLFYERPDASVGWSGAMPYPLFFKMFGIYLTPGDRLYSLRVKGTAVPFQRS